MIEQSRPSPQLEAHPARDSILWSPVRLHGPLRQRAAACTDNLRIGRALGPNKLAKRSPRPTGPWLVRPRSLTLQPCSSVTRRAPVGHAVAVRLPAFEDEAVPPTAGARRQGGPPVSRATALLMPVEGRLLHQRSDGMGQGERLGVAGRSDRPPRVEAGEPAALRLPDVADAGDDVLVEQGVADGPSRVVLE